MYILECVHFIPYVTLCNLLGCILYACTYTGQEYGTARRLRLDAECDIEEVLHVPQSAHCVVCQESKSHFMHLLRSNRTEKQQQTLHTAKIISDRNEM